MYVCVYVLVGDDYAATSATPVSLLPGGSSANSGSSDSSMLSSLLSGQWTPVDLAINNII